MPDIALRPATGADRAFIEQVYFTTQRWIIEAFFGWRGKDAERVTFARDNTVEHAQIIVVDGVDAGWLLLNRDDGISIDSLYLVPAYQRRGIGTRLLRDIIAEAQAANVELRISAATINPARRLYERLGFVLTGEERWKVNFVYRG